MCIRDRPRPPAGAECCRSERYPSYIKTSNSNAQLDLNKLLHDSAVGVHSINRITVNRRKTRCAFGLGRRSSLVMRWPLGAIPLLRSRAVTFATLVGCGLRKIVTENVVDPTTFSRFPSGTSSGYAIFVVTRHIRNLVSSGQKDVRRISGEQHVNPTHALSCIW